MIPLSAHWRFLIRAGATLVSIVLAVVLVNLVVDPYRAFGALEVHGFNAVKPRALERGFLSKLTSTASIKPQRVILGNSRAQVGLDPQSDEWRDSLITYNAALPGTGPETMVSLLRAAGARGRLQEAVIGLEFLDFLVDDKAQDREEDAPSPTAAPQQLSSKPSVDFRSLMEMTVSLDALLDSVYTVAAQHVEGSPDLTPLGFTPMHDYASMAKRDGYAPFFQQRDAENAAAYLRKPKAIFHRESRTSPAWHSLEDIRIICEALERGCTFVIYPYHAHILELFALTDLWAPFEGWKRELVRRLRPRAAPDGHPKLVLWDFSGFSRFACEPVPVPGDRSTATRWYWEAGHFKRELGDQIIARISGAGDLGFGVRLDESSIETALLSIRRDERTYRDQNPADVATLQRLVSLHRKGQAPSS